MTRASRAVEELVPALLATGEREWVELKHNNADPTEIGEYVSALANSAALEQTPFAYIVWGIEDGTRRVVGTAFRPETAKTGNEDLEAWLLRNLNPRVDVRFAEGSLDGERIVVLEVPAATHQPVRFLGNEYLRVGSYKKKLKDYPEKERRLWGLLQTERFEEGLALFAVPAAELPMLLDVPAFFETLKLATPSSPEAIPERLVEERLIVRRDDGRFDITNLGAIAFARDLNRFETLRRKAFRFVKYKGRGRTEAEGEIGFTRGYAAGFEEIVGRVMEALPHNEAIEDALRVSIGMFPRIAVRELIANAMIHQDFAPGGTGPMIELFDDRLEIRNPGLPLIDTLRFIDHSPRSRNERLADLMRRIGICEERGSGIDKVIAAIETYQLPAPEFRTDPATTISILYAHHLKASAMTRQDRVRACYQHACLCFVANSVMTNASLRKRLSISESNYPLASKILADTLSEKLIKRFDPTDKSRKHAKYVPFWA